MPITRARRAITSCRAAAGSFDPRRDGVIRRPYHHASMADDVRVRVWETGGRWYAHILDAPAFIEVTGTSRERCIQELRKVTGEDATLIIDVVPRIVGVAEAAEIMGWDKRRVVTYLDRSQFPDPLTTLASGRIWIRDDIEAFADDWRARHPRRDTESSSS
jgi:hypothetical protein